MALLLLGFPPSLQPRLSLAPPKSPFPFCISKSFDPQIPNAPKLWRNETAVSNKRFSSISALSGGSTAEAPPAAAEGEGPVEGSAEPKKRLIAQNVPWTCTIEDVRALFESHGTVVDVELSMYNSTRNRGLAFITMASEEEALAAIRNLNSYELEGRVIKVEFSRSVKKDPSSATSVPIEKYIVFAGNLAWSVRSRDLRELFNGNGSVLSAEVIFQNKPRRSAGFGFISFSSKEAAESAVATFNGKMLVGRPLNLVMKENEAEVKSGAHEEFTGELNEVNAGEDLSKAAMEIQIGDVS